MYSSEESYDFDLFVIGAGSGGVRAARVAAAHGAKVAIAEEYRVGGTCVVRGCVPKKQLFYGAHFAEDLRDAARFGWGVSETVFDWSVLRDHVLADVDRLVSLYEGALASHGVTVLHERAAIAGPHSIRMASGRVISARYIVIATGAVPSRPPVPGAEWGITSNEVFALEALPGRVVILGGGYIATEFAGILNEFGSQVTLATRSDRILRGYDAQICDRLLEISRSKGIAFRFDAPISAIQRHDDGTLQVYAGVGAPLLCDAVIFATGRSPNTQNLGLEEAGIAVDDVGAILVAEDSRTSCENIFAIGDVTNRVQLTPVAIQEGQRLSDRLFGAGARPIDYDLIPSAVFSHPPMASVGLTEEVARSKRDHIKVYTSDFRPMKNVLAGRNERALYKMVVDEDTDRVIGLHLIGPDAPEILQAAAVAVRAGATKQTFDETMALHPTMAEELVLLK